VDGSRSRSRSGARFNAALGFLRRGIDMRKATNFV